jgi:hypothetical protein
MYTLRNLGARGIDVVMRFGGGGRVGVGVGVWTFFHRRIELRALRFSHWTSGSAIPVQQIRSTGATCIILKYSGLSHDRLFKTCK